jgi:transcriptional regulator
MATIDEALKMQEKGMSQQEIIDIIKNTTRTKQAKGGLIKSITQKSMMSNLDRTLSKGLGTMFKRKR